MDRLVAIAAWAMVVACANSGTPGNAAAPTQSSAERSGAGDERPANEGQNDAPASLDESVLCSCTACLPLSACETRFSPRAEAEGQCYEERYRVPAATGCEGARSERCCD